MIVNSILYVVFIIIIALLIMFIGDLFKKK